MRDADIADFSRSLDAVCGMLSRGNYIPNPTNTAMWFRALAAHPLDAVLAGFDAHVKDPQRGRFIPMPADIVAQIEGLAADDGRPGPEEAWASALRSADEDNTVVWTDEMSQAWAIASSVFTNGDDIGARMAFKESYARLVDEARRARRPATWTASLGFNPEKRAEALRLGHAAGRLGAPELVALPAPAEALAEMSAKAPDSLRDKLRGLRDKLMRKADEPSADAVAREATIKLKAESADRLAAYRGDAA